MQEVFLSCEIIAPNVYSPFTGYDLVFVLFSLAAVFKAQDEHRYIQ